MTASTVVSEHNVIARKLQVIERKGAMRAVDVANLLGTRPETVSRWNQGRAFPRPDTEKLLLELEYIVEQLSDFYQPAETRLWLYSRQKRLDAATPAELIQQGRTNEVIEVINQLRDGSYL